MIKILKNIDTTRYDVHIDFQYSVEEVKNVLREDKLQTLIFSTSSKFFIENCEGKKNILESKLDGIAQRILLKENRGGSQLYLSTKNSWINVPSFLFGTKHSVGVGDIFNAVLMTTPFDINSSLKLSSYVAAWYSTTLIHQVFKSNVKNAEEQLNSINKLKGFRLSWEERPNYHIYIAGPDFPHEDTRLIEELDNALKYHNFPPIDLYKKMD